MQHTRAYSYDDQTGNHAGGIYVSSHASQFTQQYTRGYHSPQGSGQYYVQAGESINGVESDSYYRSMTPMAPSTQHYASPGHHRYYQSPSNGGSSSQADPYPAQSPYYASQYQRSQTPGINGSEGGQFIPTPSEMYAYSPRQLPTTPHSPPSTDPYSSAQYPPQHAFVSSSRSPELRSSRIATGRPGTSPGSPISSSSGERFPCEKCGKTFSRSHDRKRHHETQHLPSPVIHRCRYCEKEFSRADSLKRHLDNGCDEMPS
ncbi:Transcriptional regulator MET32 [Termitomyces sp. T112]|nr:hypothetical protein C0989_001627 [Termitomyces sp. Mn162]KAG5725811.1 Transcriptional regulator MET32 [Termitomyces sp. T112]